MDYEAMAPVSKEHAAAMVQSGDPKDVVQGLIRAAIHVEDWRWVLGLIEEHHLSADYWVRNACVLGLAHIARCRGEIDSARARVVLRDLVKDPAHRGNLEHIAVEDIRQFADPDFAI